MTLARGYLRYQGDVSCQSIYDIREMAQEIAMHDDLDFEFSHSSHKTRVRFDQNLVY